MTPEELLQEIQEIINEGMKPEDAIEAIRALIKPASNARAAIHEIMLYRKELTRLLQVLGPSEIKRLSAPQHSQEEPV